MVSLINDDAFMEVFVTKLCENAELLQRLRTAMFPLETTTGDSNNITPRSINSNNDTRNNDYQDDDDDDDNRDDDVDSYAEVSSSGSEGVEPVPVTPPPTTISTKRNDEPSKINFIHELYRLSQQKTNDMNALSLNKEEKHPWETIYLFQLDVVRTYARTNGPMIDANAFQRLKQFMERTFESYFQPIQQLPPDPMINYQQKSDVYLQEFQDADALKNINVDRNEKVWKEMYLRHLAIAHEDIMKHFLLSKVKNAATTFHRVQRFLEETWDIFFNPLSGPPIHPYPIAPKSVGSNSVRTSDTNNTVKSTQGHRTSVAFDSTPAKMKVASDTSTQSGSTSQHASTTNKSDKKLSAVTTSSNINNSNDPKPEYLYELQVLTDQKLQALLALPEPNAKDAYSWKATYLFHKDLVNVYLSSFPQVDRSTYQRLKRFLEETWDIYFTDVPPSLPTDKSSQSNDYYKRQSYQLMNQFQKKVEKRQKGADTHWKEMFLCHIGVPLQYLENACKVDATTYHQLQHFMENTYDVFFGPLSYPSSHSSVNAPNDARSGTLNDTKNNDSFSITIKLSGKVPVSIGVGVKSTDTISSVKARIYPIEGTPVDQQFLSLEDEIPPSHRWRSKKLLNDLLNDDRAKLTFEDLNIGEGSVFVLSNRP